MKPINSIPQTFRFLTGLTLLLAVITFTQPAARAADALIGRWITGTANLTDYSGYTPAGTHDGIAAGANAALLAWTNDLPQPGFTGQSLNLLASNVCVFITNSAVTDSNYTNTFDAGISNRFSVAFWLKQSGTAAGCLVSKSGNTPYGWQARLLTVSGQPATNRFADFTMRTTPAQTDVVAGLGSGGAIEATNVVNDGAWHHVVEVFDGTVAYRKIYVDGVLQRQVSSIPYLVNYGPITNHLVLGANQNNIGAAPTTFFPGLLFDARVYNYPISVGEVQYLNTAGLTSSKDIFTFNFPGLGAATISGTNITITNVPYLTDITALSPTYLCSALATGSPVSGTTRNFTTPQTYTITAQDSSTKTYTVTVTKAAAPSSACDILSVSWGAYASLIVGTNVSLLVPAGTDVTMLNPIVTISPFATVAPVSGSTNDFTSPVNYTVTAQDTVTTKTYAVQAVPENLWTNTAGGTWSVAGNWNPNLVPASATTTVLAFNTPGTYTSTDDLGDGFQLNLLVFGAPTVTLTGGSLQFAGVAPQVMNNSIVSVVVSNSLDLSVATTFANVGGVTLAGVISGPGALVKNGAGTLTLSGSAAGNTYNGGTTVNAGILTFGQSFSATTATPLGTGPVTMNSGTTLALNATYLPNALTLNNATVTSGNSFSAILPAGSTITLSGISTFDVSGGMTIAGNMTGSGGIVKQSSQIKLPVTGNNNYTGPTTINGGGLVFMPQSLYGADSSQWTPTNITVANGAVLGLYFGGGSDFTDIQINTLLTNLTTGVNNNGLKAGSAIGFDMSNGSGTYGYDIADSTGTGGGAVGLMKIGANTLTLSGNNTFSGPVAIGPSGTPGGTLSVYSFNSVNGGTPPLASSSLGRPTTTANGTIICGNGSLNQGIGLTYLGTNNETTDRIISVNVAVNAGGTFLTLDQSGTGLLKFTSPIAHGIDRKKVIVLRGSTSGTGEIAAAINNSATATNWTAITKSGSGTWVLSGTNTYTGATTVSAGTLLVNSPGSLAADSAVTVGSGGTLGGNGTINGTVSVADGGSLAPGASAGTLTINSNLTISGLASGSTGKLIYELGATNASDKLVVNSTLTIGAGLLDFSDFTFTTNSGFGPGTYKLITSTTLNGGDSLSANTNGTMGNFNAYLQLNGNDLELVVSIAAAPVPTVTGITGPVADEFTISGSADVAGNIVVLKATTLTPPDWTPIQTNAVSAGPFSITIPQGLDAAAFYQLMGQ